MNEADRNNILLNINRLMLYTNYNELMDYCLRARLLFVEMKEQIELHPTESIRHRRLLEKITHRGPTAYNKFLQILSCVFPEAWAVLEIKNNTF